MNTGENHDTMQATADYEQGLRLGGFTTHSVIENNFALKLHTNNMSRKYNHLMNSQACKKISTVREWQ